MKKFLSKTLIVVLILFILSLGNLNQVMAIGWTFNGDGQNYSITVNCGSNVVTVYKDGVPYKSMICSTGTATPTSGTYNLSAARYLWGKLYGGVYGQYTIRITGNILFHSVPYTEEFNPASLEYWEYDKLGTSASAGCVRLKAEDAKWIWEHCKGGTEVTFLNNSDEGPLGKPTALKITGSINQNWDPTDSDSKNPWKNIFKSRAYSITFDYKYYADKYQDLKTAFGYNENLLESHWLCYGIKEGRQASQVFDIVYYARKNSDLTNTYGNDYYSIYLHYLKFGFCEPRELSGEFDVVFYKNFYSDLLGYDNFNAATHYLEYGKNEGRFAYISESLENAVFDYKYYADKYPDLKAAFGYDYLKLKEHFFKFGAKEGRQASRTFDVVQYFNCNEDIKEAFTIYWTPDYKKCLQHFICTGINEERKTSSEFDVITYKNNYNDLRSAFGDNYSLYFEHYNKFGVNEGRQAI